jgi:hypothetical protein
VVKILAGRKTAAPGDAFTFLEKTPGDILVFLIAEASNSKAVNKVRTYLHKWRPLQQALPGVMNELESIGMPRGPKFDKVVADVFQMQLLGRARTPEDRVKILRKLSGIKEAPKKAEEKKKPDEKLKKKLMGKKGSAEPAAAASATEASKPGKQGAASAGRAPAQVAASSAIPARGARQASSKGEGQKAAASGTGKKSRPESKSRSKPHTKAGTKSHAKR